MNENRYKYFNTLQTVFITLIITGNILALKMTHILAIITPAGMICFPFTYTINDIITEVYGKKASINLIKNGLIALTIFTAFLLLSVKMVPADTWSKQSSYENVFGFAPRLFFATIIGYLSGEILNSEILSRLYQKFDGAYYLPRSIFSTLFGVLVDSITFNLCAFLFTMSLGTLVIFTFHQFILKLLFEIVGSLVSTPIVKALKAKEINNRSEERYSIKPFLQ